MPEIGVQLPGGPLPYVRLSSLTLHAEEVRLESLTSASDGVCGVAVSARQAVNLKVRVRLPSDTPQRERPDAITRGGPLAVSELHPPPGLLAHHLDDVFVEAVGMVPAVALEIP